MRADRRIARQRRRRAYRVHNRVRRSAHGRPRLTVYRSQKHMSAQIIDDEAGRTLAAASTLEKELYGAGSNAGNKQAAAKVGQVLAERAAQKGIKRVVFDRGRYKFHGRVAALATAAREGGLEF